MTTVTISEVTSAVNKAFAAGIAGQAYEGLMPSAYDAGVAWVANEKEAQAGKSVSVDQALFLSSLQKTAVVGFQEGSTGSPLRTDYYGEADVMMTTPLSNANRNVYIQAHETGKSITQVTPTNWTPWLIGGGIAAAALVVGAVVISRTASSNPSGEKRKEDTSEFVLVHQYGRESSKTRFKSYDSAVEGFFKVVSSHLDEMGEGDEVDEMMQKKLRAAITEEDFATTLSLWEEYMNETFDIEEDRSRKNPSWIEPESYKTLYDGLDAARQYATATGNRYYVGVGIGLRGASVHPRSSRVDSEGLYFEVNSKGDIRYVRQDRRGKYKEAWKGSDLDAASAAGKRLDATSWKVAA